MKHLLAALLSVPSLAIAITFGGAMRPWFTVVPVDMTVWEGDTVVLQANALATPGASYQWRKNGLNIPGATLPALTFERVMLSDAGNYDVVATNQSGSEKSPVGVLTVKPAVTTITTQPVGVTVDAGATTILEVFATGPRLTHQWKKDGQALPGATHSSLTLISVTAADEGTYSVVVSAERDFVESDPAVVRVRPPPTSITAAPAGGHLAAGGSFSCSVTASGWDLAYRWKKDGVVIAGATTSSLALAGVTAADMGFYSVVVTGAGGEVQSLVAIVTVAIDGGSRLANASTRAFVPAGGVLTPGFALRGYGTKQVLLRAVGPTLGALGVETPLQDPRLDLIPAGASVALASSDDWGGPAALVATSARVGAFALPANSKDAAVQTGLAVNGVGVYSVRVGCSSAAASGVALAEVYDADAANSPVRIINLSTLGFVGVGANGLTSGFVISGSAPKQLLIRAAGPGLTALGVDGVLTDPQFTVVSQSCDLVVARNDNWVAADELNNATSTAGAFALPAGSKDAALVVRLPPGGYTVTVAGAGNSTGTALVEIYDLDP